MRQLLPEIVDDVDPVAVYLDADRPVPDGRPWTALGMIASVDGATAVDGKSGQLGGAGDKAVFRAVRAMADVVVVAAGTARAENYGPVSLPEAVVAQRRARGRPDQPALAVVTRSGDLDPSARLFAGGHRPLVILPDDVGAEVVDRLGEVAELARFGSGDVDLAGAWQWLHSRFAVAAVEGGPSFNGALAASGLVDEVCLTIAPAIAGGDSSRIIDGAGPRLDRYELASLLCDDDGFLFTRYVRRR